MTRCTCYIIPKEVLERFAGDKKLTAELRKASADTSRVSDAVRSLRTQAGHLTAVSRTVTADLADLAATAKVTVYDCKHSQTLPGTPVASPKTAKDATAVRAFVETTAVATFYQKVFGRNSVDNAGMTLMSSVHFGRNYNNAMWNGSQMLYGDGDGQLFIDFTNGNDVIGHELTHGVTQNTLQLAYSGDAGGLNESLSDCFGSMFRQWEASQDVTAADWLIGADILGPVAKSKGYKSLRNMADPTDKSAIAPQPALYSQLTPGMDPHYTSGPPNLAFCTACKTLGGKSWEKVGQVWYSTMVSVGASPNMTMPQFASQTRQAASRLFPAEPAVSAAVDAGWKQVGL
jgi:Zn-dependent metalloprotease